MSREDLEREHLDAYRAQLTPDAETAGQNWAAIEDRIARGELPMELPEEVPEPPGARHGTAAIAWLGAAVAVAAAVVALSGVTGHLLSERGTERATQEAPYEAQAATSVGGRVEAHAEIPSSHGGDEPSPREPAPDATANSEANEPGTPIPEAPDETAPRAKPRHVRPRAAPEPEEHAAPTEERPAATETAARVGAEAALVGQARAALRDHNPRSALDLLDTYSGRFPQGQLAQEAELVRLAALCDLGQRTQARAGARAFVDAHPDSPLSGHARRICADEADQP